MGNRPSQDLSLLLCLGYRPNMVCGVVEMVFTQYLTSLLYTDNNIINMKTHLMILLIGITIYGCSTEKTVVIQSSNKSQPITRSRSLESQRELADLMDSWTCEEIEEFKRKYVYSEVNIFLKNGDTLTVKKK